uniref:Cytochrome P450 n=1 Tax=Setaria italica TaxID=4555 RepID=K3XX99_SETIT
MASQLPSLAASAGLCLLSVLAAALLAVTLYILAVVASFAVFCAREFARRDQDRDRPPLVGTVFRQLNNFHRLFDEHVNYALAHPTSRLVYPGHSEFYTADPVIIEHVLKTSSSKYSKGIFNYSVMKDLFGDGIFAADGDKWRHQRKLASHEFSTKVLREFSSVVFRTNARKLADKISSAATSGTIINMQELLMKTTMDSIFKVGFGFELNTLSGTDESSIQFSDAFDEANSLVYHRYVDLFWKLKRYFNIGSEAKLKRNIQIIDDFVMKLIHQKREQMNGQDNDGKMAEEDDVLPNGYRVIKGDGMNYMIYAMGRMTYLWGEDAEDFRPERWLVNGVFQQESPYKFVSFNAGPRICLGKEFAYRQMKIVAATLIHFFRFKLADESKDATYKTMFTLHMDKGLHLHAYRRST